MKNQNHRLLLKSISKVFNETKKVKLDNFDLEPLESELAVIQEYLNVDISDFEALFFAVIVSLNFIGREVDLNDLCRHFDSDPFELICHLNAVESMTEKGIIRRKSSRRRNYESSPNKIYFVPDKLCEAIMREYVCPEFKNNKINNLPELLESIYEIIDQCINNEISPKEMHQEILELLNKHNEYHFIKSILSLKLNNIDVAVLLYVTWQTLSGSNNIDVDLLLKNIIVRNSERVMFIQTIYSGQNQLLKDDFIGYRESHFLSDLEFYITDKTKRVLEQDGLKFLIKNSRRSDIINPSNIGQKQLFYNQNEKRQLDRIIPLLEEDQFKALVTRMNECNLPSGLNILLYGAPGTGKTETAFQLAKASGREIIKVDISKTKSMWFGESEKIIKRIFNDYREYAANTDIAPILLFNEGDAILSKRGNSSDSNTRQTENAIQNILLEELENFKGIFIATTNLVTNLDNAFDRRFLFKVEFELPSIENRSQIWKNKMPFLDLDACYSLAEQYPFSGGQIDNIVRKCEIEFILEGNQPDISTILYLCHNESFVSKHSKNKIGFSSN